MKKYITLFYALSAFIFLSILTSLTYAQTGSMTASGQFSLQGMLTNVTGTPISDGQHSLIADIYANGQLVYSETDNITTLQGMFSTMIGANGNSATNLTVIPGTDYQLGVSVDGGAELAPRISLASSLSSLTAKLAANADSVGGFGVSTNGNVKANTLLVLNGSGKIDSSLLTGSLVTSLNGITGPITIQGGGNLGIASNGNILNLSFIGDSATGLLLPFSQTLNLASGTGFNITNSLAGSAATFANTGLGSALNVTSMSGSAINATSTGILNGSATINVQNNSGTAIKAVSNIAGNPVLMLQNLSSGTGAQLLRAVNASDSTLLDIMANGQTTINSSVGNALNVSSSAGTAINATATAGSDAVLKLQNLASDSSASLLKALNSAGSSVLSVASNGKTSINSTVDNALTITTSATGGNALSINGGLKITGGAAGTGIISSGQLQTTITNSLVKSNSIILVTVSGAASAVAMPLQVSSQSNGSFVVSAITSLLGLTGNLNFSYLIINQ